MPAKLPDGEGKRFAIAFRTTRRLEEAIKAAAAASGRSVAAELEMRVTMTFERDFAAAERKEITDIIRAEMRLGFAQQRAEAEGLPLPNMSDADRAEWLRN